MKIVLVRTDIEMEPRYAEAARQFFLGSVDGLNREDKTAWRKFLKRLFLLSPGEMTTIETKFDRSGPFHRRHMKLETVLFDSQERFEHFEVFRDWLKVGAGYVQWAPGPKGAIVPIPKSISYASLEEVEFREVHSAMVAFLRTEHAGRALWPHLAPAARTEMIDGILGGFGE